MAKVKLGIDKNINRYYEGVEMPGGYRHVLPEVLKFIDLYYNGKFESGPAYPNGQFKYFTNKTRPPCDIASKFIDLDTKDVILRSLSGEASYKILLLQRELFFYLREENFGVLLNNLGDNFPKYGHIVTKMVNGTVKQVNIQNLRMDPSAPFLNESDFVYELFKNNPRQIRAMRWNQTEAIKDLLATKQTSFLIYDCYDLNVNEGKKWNRTIKARIFKDEGRQRAPEAVKNDGQDTIEGFVLHKDEVDELPYDEEKLFDVPGRWLGFGFPEYIFDNQVKENERENLESQGLHWKAWQGWQTRDETAPRNLFVNAENGQVLRVKHEITPIQKDNSDLAAYNASYERNKRNIEEKTFSFDISRGGELPSRTPLGVAEISAGMVTSFYNKLREKYGLFVRRLVLNNVLPSFAKTSNKEHVLLFMGSDNEIDKFDRAVAEAQVDQRAFDMVISTGRLPVAEERKAEVDRVIKDLKSRKDRHVKIPASFYSNVKYFADIVITGEQIDTAAVGQTLLTALQLIASNPTIIADPTTRTVFFKLLEMKGVSPVELGLLKETAERQPPAILPQGGSVGASRTQAPVNTIPTQTQV